MSISHHIRELHNLLPTSKSHKLKLLINQNSRPGWRLRIDIRIFWGDMHILVSWINIWTRSPDNLTSIVSFVIRSQVHPFCVNRGPEINWLSVERTPTKPVTSATLDAHGWYIHGNCLGKGYWYTRIHLFHTDVLRLDEDTWDEIWLRLTSVLWPQYIDMQIAKRGPWMFLPIGRGARMYSSNTKARIFVEIDELLSRAICRSKLTTEDKCLKWTTFECPQNTQLEAISSTSKSDLPDSRD